jgi:hypothetical protein
VRQKRPTSSDLESTVVVTVAKFGSEAARHGCACNPASHDWLTRVQRAQSRGGWGLQMGIRRRGQSAAWLLAREIRSAVRVICGVRVREVHKLHVKNIVNKSTLTQS